MKHPWRWIIGLLVVAAGMGSGWLAFRSSTLAAAVPATAAAEPTRLLTPDDRRHFLQGWEPPTEGAGAFDVEVDFCVTDTGAHGDLRVDAG